MSWIRLGDMVSLFEDLRLFSVKKTRVLLIGGIRERGATQREREEDIIDRYMLKLWCEGHLLLLI